MVIGIVGATDRQLLGLRQVDLEGLEKGVDLLDVVGVVASELPHARVRQALAEDVNEAAGVEFVPLVTRAGAAIRARSSIERSG